MRCATCGKEHDILDLEPSFFRPDAVLVLSKEERQQRVKENDDICLLRGQHPTDPYRYFVRSVLPVQVEEFGHAACWGLWAEVSRSTFERVMELWNEPDQRHEPAKPATIANRIPGYMDTIGLRARLRLNSPTARPFLEFEPDETHEFARECREGVSVARFRSWLESMKS